MLICILALQPHVLLLSQRQAKCINVFINNSIVSISCKNINDNDNGTAICKHHMEPSLPDLAF